MKYRQCQAVNEALVSLRMTSASSWPARLKRSTILPLICSVVEYCLHYSIYVCLLCIVYFVPSSLLIMICSSFTHTATEAIDQYFILLGLCHNRIYTHWISASSEIYKWSFFW